MSILYKDQIITNTAKADFTGCEGCFVSTPAPEGGVTLTTASTAAASVLGVLHTENVSGGEVTILLPGFSGITEVLLHSTGSSVTPGCLLVLSANGQVKYGTSGTVVAVALATASPGNKVMARLVQPYTLTA